MIDQIVAIKFSPSCSQLVHLVNCSQSMHQRSSTTWSQFSSVCWSIAIDYSSILGIGVRSLFCEQNESFRPLRESVYYLYPMKSYFCLAPIIHSWHHCTWSLRESHPRLIVSSLVSWSRFSICLFKQACSMPFPPFIIVKHPSMGLINCFRLRSRTRSP